MGDLAAIESRVSAASAGLSLGDERGYIGEPVSQLEHALQCADFAQAAHASSTEVLGALFHDIGHLIAPPGAADMAGLGIVDHESIGAAWLGALGFSAHVCELVRAHVDAKRYLACRKTGYYERLSEASRGTLRFQGGPMSDAEAAAFEADPLFAAKVRVRMWDEAAKEPERRVPGLEAYARLIHEHLEQGR